MGPMLRFEDGEHALPEGVFACSLRRLLIGQFWRSVSVCTTILCTQLEAVILGNDIPFGREMAKAADRRERARDAVIVHTLEHG